MKINIKRILCPTDMSPQSDEALRYAIALARAYQAKLFVCHCADSPALADESKARGIHQMIESVVSNHTRLAPSPALVWESIL